MYPINSLASNLRLHQRLSSVRAMTEADKMFFKFRHNCSV